MKRKRTPFPKMYRLPYIGNGQITQWPKNVATDQKPAIRPQRWSSFALLAAEAGSS